MREVLYQTEGVEGPLPDRDVLALEALRRHLGEAEQGGDLADRPGGTDPSDHLVDDDPFGALGLPCEVASERLPGPLTASVPPPAMARPSPSAESAPGGSFAGDWTGERYLVEVCSVCVQVAVQASITMR